MRVVLALSVLLFLALSAAEEGDRQLQIAPGEVEWRLVPDSSIAAAVAAAATEGRTVIAAINGGLFHDRTRPVGLLVVAGREVAPFEAGEGQGNFFLKPNGVVRFAADGQVAIIASDAWQGLDASNDSALQSGPLLLAAGHLHPRLRPDSDSRYRRSAIGVRADGAVVLLSTRARMNFHTCAVMLRDGFGCREALYLDGAISGWWDAGGGWETERPYATVILALQPVPGGVDAASPDPIQRQLEEERD